MYMSSKKQQQKLENKYCSQFKHAGDCKKEGCYPHTNKNTSRTICQSYSQSKDNWGCKNWEIDEQTGDVIVIDPISMEPVNFKKETIKLEGNCYSKCTICRWLKHNPTSPLTRVKVDPHILAKCGIDLDDMSNAMRWNDSLQAWRDVGYSNTEVPIDYSNIGFQRLEQDYEDHEDYDYDYDDYEEEAKELFISRLHDVMPAPYWVKDILASHYPNNVNDIIIDEDQGNEYVHIITLDDRVDTWSNILNLENYENNIKKDSSMSADEWKNMNKNLEYSDYLMSKKTYYEWYLV